MGTLPFQPQRGCPLHRYKRFFANKLVATALAFFTLLFFTALTTVAQPVAGLKANGKIMNQGETITTCVGTSIVYESIAQGFSALTWRFENGSGGTGNSGLQTILYNTPGTDTTWQFVSQGSQKDSMYVLVRVTNIKPLANFNFNPNGECANIPVVFNNGSTGTGLKYNWYFGDGGTSTQNHPTYQFLNAIGATGSQTYAVKLVVTNDQFCKDSITKNVSVLKIPDASITHADGQIQNVDFNGVPTFKVCQNIPQYTYSFANASTTLPINKKYTIKWGDTSPDSVFTTWAHGAIIRHNYPIGQTKMEIHVEGANGCIGIKKYNIFLGTTPAGGFEGLGNETVCAPNALSFVITGYANNATGTTYKVLVNDGTTPDLFNQPPPDTVSHVFNISSCGIQSSNGSQTFSNSFRASLDIENPCGAKSVSVIPIYISGKPKALINLYPSETVCTGTSVYIEDNSIYGGSIISSGVNSTCSNTGKRVWSISPATGYAISASYNMGSFNGAPQNGVLWSSGAPYFYANFTTPGEYKVKLYVFNNSCGIDSITKTICVRNKQVASFTMDKKSGCGPDSVHILNTSPAGLCKGDSYQWTVQYSDPSNCGGSGSYSFIDGSTETSRNPAIRFNNPGRYIISLTATAVGAQLSCPTAVARDTFYVKAKPKAQLTTLAAMCLGNPIAPKATVNNCYSTTTPSYLWTFAGGNPASFNGAVPGEVHFGGIGSYKIQLQVENECGTTLDSTTALITSKPTANAGPDVEMCSGTTGKQIGAAAQSGLTYSWTPAAGLSSSTIAQPGINLTYTGPSADTTIIYVVTVQAGQNCMATDTVVITVKRNPNLSIQPAAPQICAGGSVQLIASGAATYVWTPASGLNTTSGDTVIASPPGTTLYNVVGTAANGCQAQTSITVSVTNYQTVWAGSDTLVCNTTTSVRLQGTPTGGVWSGHPQLSAAGVFNPAAAGNGVYSLYYTSGTGSCVRTDSIQVTVSQPPVTTIGSDTTVCHQLPAFQLQAAPAGGSWSGSPLVSSSGLFNPTTVGTHRLVYTIGGGTCIDTDTMEIIVAGGIVNNIITGNQNVCTGALPQPINGQDASGGNGQLSYQWQIRTNNSTWTNINGATARDYQPTTIQQTTWYRRIAYTQLCSGPQSSISPTVELTLAPDATAQFEPANTIGCTPFHITPAVINLLTFPYSVSEYRWLVNANYLGSDSIFPGFTLNNPADSVTVTLVAVSRFGCKNDTVSKTFITVETPSPDLQQNIREACGPVQVTFTNTTPHAERYRVLWDFGQGQTSIETHPSPVVFPINPHYGDTVYQISFKTITACDTITRTTQVQVRAQPKALFTPNKTEGCSPMRVTFSNTSRGSNAHYVWDFGDGSARLANDQASVQHTFTTAVRDTFIVKLIGTNDCGSDTMQYAIVVNPNSIRLDYAINGNEKFGCAPHAVRFINNTTGANTFVWKFGDGDSLITTRGIDTVVHTYTNPGTYQTQLYASNSCNDTTDYETVTIEMKPTVRFSASPLISCINDTIRFINTSNPGLSNTWKFGDGSSSSIINPVKTYAYPDTFRVWLIGSRAFSQGFSCSDSMYADIIIRDTIPGSFTASSTNGSCLPFTVRFSNLQLPSTSTLWHFGDGTTGTGDTISYTYTANGDYMVHLYQKNTTGCTYASKQKISVLAPVGTLTYTAGYLCSGVPARFEIKNGNAAQYIFVFGDGDTLRSTSPVAHHVYTRPGNYIPHAYLSNNGCLMPLHVGDTIKVDATIAGFMYTTQYQCGATTLSFTDTSHSFFGNKNRLWNFGDGTTFTLQQPVKIYTQGGTYLVSLLVTGNSGCTDTITTAVNVVVRNYPVATIGGDTSGCTQQQVNLAALVQSTDPISDYRWSLGNNVNGNGAMVAGLYNATGTYPVQLIATTTFGCADTASRMLRVHSTPVVTASADQLLCRGQSVQLSATGANTYLWSPLQNLSCTSCPNPVTSPTTSINYVVRGANLFGCSATDTVRVQVIQPSPVTVSAGDTICIGQQTQLLASGTARYVWSPSNGLSSTTIANPMANPRTTTEYRVTGSDMYNCFTSTAVVRVVVGPYPTVNLGTGRQVVAGSKITLQPQVTNGPIAVYTWQPATDLSCSNCLQPVATINNNITYRLEVVNIWGCSASDTIQYTIRCEEASQVYLPNAFSPDGDGLNDQFVVRGRGLATVKYFRVFNRWGQMIFEKNNFNANDPRYGWDGKVNGMPASPDVYVYTAEMMCTGGEVYVKKGNVTLVR